MSTSILGTWNVWWYEGNPMADILGSSSSYPSCFSKRTMATLRVVPNVSIAPQKSGYKPPRIPGEHNKYHGYTPEIEQLAPKNRQSQKETHFPTIIFQGLC